MSRLGAALDRRVFGSAPASQLALQRIALGAYTAHYLGRRVGMLRKVHRTDPVLFAPVGPVRALSKPLPPCVADALVSAELVAATAFALGVRHRVTGPLHSALLLWTLSYRNSWSMVFHNDNTLVLHTAVTGLSPAADTWSVDAVGRPTPAPHWRYAFPTGVSSAVTAAAYLVAGLAKVRGPLGWGWASGDALRSQVAADGLRKALLGSSAATLGVRLYRHTWLWRLMAVGSLLAELLAPLALLDRRLGRMWAVLAFSMHWGIKAVMGVTFRYHLSGAAYLSFLRWPR